MKLQERLREVHKIRRDSTPLDYAIKLMQESADELDRLEGVGLDFKGRLEKEAEELSRRLEALQRFLFSENFFGLGSEMQRLLVRQEVMMSEYLLILRARLDLLDKAS